MAGKHNLEISKHERETVASEYANGVTTPFTDAMRLLRDLADLQNGAPLERHRKEWEETMDEVYSFLNEWGDT